MKESMKYYKLMYILNELDYGYGAGGVPTGYLKIECRNNTGRVNLMVQNLKTDSGEYKLYFLESAKGTVNGIYIDKINVMNNRGELNLEFDTKNIKQSGIGIERINIFVITYENGNAYKSHIPCPLAAFKSKDLVWNEKNRDEIMNISQIRNQKSGESSAQFESIKLEESNKLPEKKIDIFSKYEGALESNYYNSQEKNIKGEIYINKDTKSNEKVANDKAESANEISKTTEEIDKDINKIIDENIDKKIDKEAEQEVEEKKNIDAVAQDADNLIENKKEEINTKNEFNNEDINALENFKTEEQNKNEDRKIHDVGRIQVNMRRLVLQLNKYFERCEPFGTRRNDYRWWKVMSIALLNNIIYQNGIRTHILFNPRVAMANYKFRHIICGVYSDKATKKEFLVFGIPAVNKIDREPFEDFCRWVEINNENKQYAKFGYWLMYINPANGTILKV